MPRLTPDELLQELTGAEDLLIVQDLDGVCMQLVKDPLTRRMDPSYVDAVAALDGQFAVLTNGEHEGCLLYTSPSPRDRQKSRMPSSA